MSEFAETQNGNTARSLRGRLPSGRPNPVDAHVGQRLRLRRTLLGLSQEELGHSVGLTFQQIQKYEHGANRIGTSRLWDLSRALNCSVSYFFEEMDDTTAGASPRNLTGETEEPAQTRAADPMSRRETLELVRAYYTIRDPHVRRRIVELARALTPVDDPEEETEVAIAPSDRDVTRQPASAPGAQPGAESVPMLGNSQRGAGGWLTFVNCANIC
jgi:transcriptional regulator with XRE-family HTH domain